MSIAVVLSYATISMQNNLHCKYELRSQVEDFIDSLEIKCDYKKRGIRNEIAVKTVFHNSGKNIGVLIAEEENTKKLEGMRVEMFPFITQYDTLKLMSNKNLSKIPQNILQSIKNSKISTRDIHSLESVFNELKAANDVVTKTHRNATSFSVSARKNFNLPHLENVKFKTDICINRWTPEKDQSKTFNVTEEDCHPSKRNVEISSTFLLQTIQELSIQDEELFDKIDESDRKILELENEMRNLKMLI